MRKKLFTPIRRLAAWLIHTFTAFGAIIGLFAVDAIYTQDYVLAFWLMGIAVGIDAVDGTFARFLHVKVMTPDMDGALLDNIVDYLNYVFIPALFIMVSPMIDLAWRPVTASVIILASAYQFCQKDAKTKDNFFKGFPSYWNIIIFYLFFWQTTPQTNLMIIFFLAALVFVPIKYVYPSRLTHLTRNKSLQKAMLLATIVWGASTFALIWLYPKSYHILVGLSMGYVLLYILLSLLRTFKPLRMT